MKLDLVCDVVGVCNYRKDTTPGDVQIVADVLLK